MALSPVMIDSGNMTVDKAMSIQSFKTPATRMVTAPVLPITKNIEKFNTRAQIALEKNIHKLNCICDISIFGSLTNTKVSIGKENCKRQKKMNY